ncbi:MAG: carboxylating nicotinate-nucleotide diphosphorylase [Elusimicrobiota bacterium]
MRRSRDAERLVAMALREDLGRAGDITTRCFLPRGGRFSAVIRFKESGVLCGTRVVDAVFRKACPPARVRWLRRDGQGVRAGQVVARVEGPRGILTAERTALNFLQKLSGMATLTRRYADETRGRARIYDTRKTLPGWRGLSKYAVRTGGGCNHRMGLYDMAMLKDNHISALGTKAATLVRRFRRRHPGTPIEMEARNEREVRLALELGADIIMLDNMSEASLRRLIRLIRSKRPRVEVEVSGGVELRKVRRLALLKPDRISVGRITHSAPALDISMKLCPKSSD